MQLGAIGDSHFGSPHLSVTKISPLRHCCFPRNETLLANVSLLSNLAETWNGPLRLLIADRRREQISFNK